MQSEGIKDPAIAKTASDIVCFMIEEKFGGYTIPSVEQIQDIVEMVLMKQGYHDVAKNYILYREKHKGIREAKKIGINLERLVKDYLSNADWKIRENSNEGVQSFAGLNARVSGEVLSNFALNQIYTERAKKAHRDGRVPHPRPELPHRRLLRRLVPREPHPQGLRPRPQPGPLQSRQAPRHPDPAHGQLHRDHAGRVRRGPGLLQRRHPPRPLRPPGQPQLRGRQAGHAEAHLRAQRPLPLGLADALLQPDLRLDHPRGHEEQEGRRRRRRARHLLRRLPEGGRLDQPGLPRDHDRGRPQGPGLHLPHPDLQPQPRVRLGFAQGQAPLRRHGQVRHPVLPELHRHEHEPRRHPGHVLPAQPRPARAHAPAREHVGARRLDRLHRRRHHQPQPGRLRGLLQGGLLRPAEGAHDRRQGHARGQARDRQQHAREGHDALHQGLPRPLRQPLLDDRRLRHARGRDELPQAGHRHARGPRLRQGDARAHARRPARVPGGDRPPLQPRGHPGRIHGLPPGPAGPAEIPPHLHLGHGEAPLPHQLDPAQRRRHPGHLRGHPAPGRDPAPLHRRHHLPRLPARGHRRRDLQEARPADRPDQAAVLLHHPDLQRLHEPRLPPRPAPPVPGVRRRDRGLQPDRRLHAAGADLERRQAAGVRGPDDLQQDRLRPGISRTRM
ncbi:MAG: ATP cone domain-containing protein [Ignavibacteriales bacterium]|nr:ATP cone domain-containing protein [Ignavibacteriales bacterium]